MKHLFSPLQVIHRIETAAPTDRLVLRVLLVVVLVTGLWFLISITNATTVTDVRAGGALHEGIVGTPRFVNPVLALTRADQDITELVYSGLLTRTATGSLATDLASSWEVSPDGRRYTITLRDDIAFHDGTPITATDVLYTIRLIQNEDLKSPLRANWSGAQASSEDERTITITLEEPYAPFVYNLTTGIMPAHIWRPIPIEQIPFSTFNTTPVGSGPYEITDATFSTQNGTVATYTLTPATTHTPTALISEIKTSFYPTEADVREALAQNDIDSTAYISSKLTTPDNANSTHSSTPLTRTFTLFFNQNRSEALRDSAVREALELVIDREAVVTASLKGAGIPSQYIGGTQTGTVNLGIGHSTTTKDTTTETGQDIARLVLEEAGWNQTDTGSWVFGTNNETESLSVTIRTANTPIFNDAVDEISAQWEAFGITVTTEQFTQSDLVGSVIRDRDFEVLLFGIDAGASGDLYPFWHSSQQDDPGLNIAQYANITVDESLETLLSERTEADRSLAKSTIRTIINEERPAIFLMQPTVEYHTPDTLTSTLPNILTKPADRFTYVETWYIESERLWPFFTNKST